MKTYKSIDYYGNFVLLIAIVLYTFIKGDLGYLDSFYLCFSIWHSQSALVHFLNKQQYYYHPKRKIYEYLILMLAIILLTFYVSDRFFDVIFLTKIAMMFSYLLLIVSPVLAIHYMFICNKEIEEMNRRPISYFK